MENVNQETQTQSTTRGRYVGPSAARIAELIAPQQRVRFERGWFWTAAKCHDAEQQEELMALRQRPDGDGIDVRCKSAGCSRERIIRSLERLTGESIWSAYTTERRAPETVQTQARGTGGTESEGGRSWRPALASAIVLLLAAPIVLGADLQVVALNAAGFAWAGWLGQSFVLSRRRAIARRGRNR